MPSDLERLRVLIPHWIEHNAEHAEEFRRWAERARAAGADAAADHIIRAAEAMEGSNRDLQAALSLASES